MASAVAAAAANAVPAKAKKKQNNRGYLKYDVPSVDTVVEEDKLRKKLALAQQQLNWKLEAQALLQLGQLMKWKGLLEIGDDFLEQSAVILRDHTFADGVDDDDEGQS